MATNVITELDQQLASLNQLKAPGASKGKISTITNLCMNNIQAESNIVQSLYRALKKAPATHKLGALYVIDSVVRRWIEKAKENGQDLTIEGRGEPGTYNAAVKRVTELMPALFDDILKNLPADQKPKLENMVKIWENGHTFPVKLLADMRVKLSGEPMQDVQMTNGTNGVNAAPAAKKAPSEKFAAPIPSRPLHTPVGYPPQYLYEQGMIARIGEQNVNLNINGTAGHSANAAAHSRPPPPQQTASQQPPAPAPAPQAQGPPQQPQDVNSILAALAQAIPQPAAPTPSQPAQQPAAPPMPMLPPGLPPNIAALLGQAMQQQNGVPPPTMFQQPVPPQPQPQQPAYSAPSSAPQQMPAFQMPPGFPGFAPPRPPPSVPQTYAAAPPPPQPAAPADPLAPLRGILPANILSDQGKLVMALNLLQDLQKQGLPMDQWGPILKAFDDAQPPTQSNGYDQYGRRRSRSPERGGRRGGRASPVYGTYEDLAAKKQAEEDRMNGGRGRNHQRNWRQRSPIVTMRDLPMQMDLGPGPVAMNGMPMQPKYIAIDTSLPENNIKVLSRTLFVGGANGTQAEIQSIFERFGRVQTCIANREKRHAFVKMTTRNHALAAKAGMEELQSRNDRETMQVARQTKWGVGFGPRECCDYQRGESIIPIHKLTDADVKWLMTAEYGGTGGKALEGGMVLEEPDIEIGAGVSSKAMSKRLPVDDGHQIQQSSNKRQHNDDGHGDHHRVQKHNKEAHRHNKKHKKHQHNDYDRAPQDQSGVYGADPYARAPPPPQVMEHYGYERPLIKPEPVAVATPPAVPTFGFSLPGVPGQSYR